jgi:hypothetical protein
MVLDLKMSIFYQAINIKIKSLKYLLLIINPMHIKVLLRIKDLFLYGLIRNLNGIGLKL